MFKEFYSIYPRKKSPLDAEKAWKQMLAQGYTEQQMIDGAKKFAAECRAEGREAKYTPYPASWLRAGGFLDYEHETIKPQPLFRPARTVDELRQYLQSIGKPVSAEIAKARDVTDLPAFARMVPADWHPNVTQIRKAG